MPDVYWFSLCDLIRSLWVSVSVSLFVSLSVSLCLSLSVSLCLSVCLSLSLSLSLWLHLCLSLSKIKLQYFRTDLLITYNSTDKYSTIRYVIITVLQGEGGEAFVQKRI